jgi:hypothetical protein
MDKQAIVLLLVVIAAVLALLDAVVPPASGWRLDSIAVILTAAAVAIWVPA